MHSNMYVLVGTPCVSMVMREGICNCHVSVVGSLECADCVRVGTSVHLRNPCGTEDEAVGAAAPC